MASAGRIGGGPTQGTFDFPCEAHQVHSLPLPLRGHPSLQHIGDEPHLAARRREHDRGHLQGVEPFHLVHDVPFAHVPEAQRAVEVPRHHNVAVHRHTQRTARGSAHQALDAKPLVQVPHLRTRTPMRSKTSSVHMFCRSLVYALAREVHADKCKASLSSVARLHPPLPRPAATERARCTPGLLAFTSQLPGAQKRPHAGARRTLMQRSLPQLTARLPSCRLNVRFCRHRFPATDLNSIATWFGIQ
jgi:hypothetical protein